MIKQIKSGFNQKASGQAEKQLKISEYNAKLIKYSPYATKSVFWGALPSNINSVLWGAEGVFLIESRFGVFLRSHSGLQTIYGNMVK